MTLLLTSSPSINQIYSIIHLKFLKIKPIEVEINLSKRWNKFSNQIYIWFLFDFDKILHPLMNYITIHLQRYNSIFKEIQLKFSKKIIYYKTWIGLENYLQDVIESSQLKILKKTLQFKRVKSIICFILNSSLQFIL